MRARWDYTPILGATADQRRAFWRKTRSTDDCLLYEPAQRNGWAQHTFERKSLPAHRVALIWYTQSAGGEQYALHRCASRNCVNPRHLYWGTPQDNMNDRRRAAAPGASYGALGDEVARAIFCKYHQGLATRAQLARAHKVSAGSVQSVLQRKTHRAATEGLAISSAAERRQRRKQTGCWERSRRKWLTTSQVLEIDAHLFLGRYSKKAIAASYGISAAALHHLEHGKTWGEVTGRSGVEKHG